MIDDLRTHIAVEAMKALISASPDSGIRARIKAICATAYEIADAMLEVKNARDKEKP